MKLIKKHKLAIFALLVYTFGMLLEAYWETQWQLLQAASGGM